MKTKNHKDLFRAVPRDRLQTLAPDELILLVETQQEIIEKIIKDNERLRDLNNELKEKSLFVDERFIKIKNKLFGKSSEKEPSKADRIKASGGGNRGKKRVQLPSLRYPNAPLIEREVDFEEAPNCTCCGCQMSDSGMTENSEFLTVIPAQFLVVRQKRHKYRCGKCHGAIVTAPCPPRIKPGSGFSDEMVLDIALSKYCDLIPIERYSSIAGRNGLKDLPPQSLIEQTHYLADFVEGAYNKVKEEVLESKVLQADETTHRMLEGDDKSHWYLWGFSNETANYFDIRNTRSGDVASELLIKSKCEFLVSDVFSGYGKAVRVTNEERKKLNLPLISNVYCNAHSRRNFKGAQENFHEEAQYFIDLYKKIYQLEKIAKDRPPDRVLRVRKLMAPLFENMKNRALANIEKYSSKSSIAQAMSYFLKNYEGLTRFVNNKNLPIDNNRQEATLRNPVVGRKTWYGTHSIRGAKTAAIIFTLVESSKLNLVNPRVYFKKLIENIHAGKKCFTPKEFKDLNL